MCPFNAAMTSFGRVLEAEQRLVGVQAEEVLEAGRDGVQHPDVGAGREEPVALAAQDDDVHVVVEAGLQDGLVELPHHRVGVGVRRRVVHLDDRDAVGGAVVNDLLVVVGARPDAGLGGGAHWVLLEASNGEDYQPEPSSIGPVGSTHSSVPSA